RRRRIRAAHAAARHPRIREVHSPVGARVGGAPQRPGGRRDERDDLQPDHEALPARPARRRRQLPGRVPAQRLMPMGVDRPLAVFFDLDGTLADTAEDLAAPIHAMRADRGLAPIPDEDLRPYASMGARGLILKGLGVARDDPGFEPLRLEFLRRYEAAMLVRTRLFPGMPEVLDALDDAGIRWGVV